MDEIHVPNDATYAPVALGDLVVAAPLVSRLLLKTTLPGRVVSAAALGVYAGSALKDWLRRRDVRWIDFESEFAADVHRLDPMPAPARREEVDRLAARLRSGPAPPRRRRAELARDVNHHLTEYIASVTGQRVYTSSEVRRSTLARFVLPFAGGACDPISGDVALFGDAGALEPHVLAHELVHRKGYWKELHAQALAYLALAGSGDPLLMRAALSERLHRNLRVLAGDDGTEYRRLVDGLGLDSDLVRDLHRPHPEASANEPLAAAMRSLYDRRLKLTGQNGLSDYDEGFTNFLWTFSRARSARQDPATARV